MMERRKSKGLRMKLLLLTIVPIVLVGVILFLISASSMQASLQQLSRTRVKDLADAILEAYEKLYMPHMICLITFRKKMGYILLFSMAIPGL